MDGREPPPLMSLVTAIKPVTLRRAGGEMARDKAKLFVTLDDHAYEAAPAPTLEAVRDAFAKGSEDLRLASSQPRPRRIGRRFR